MRHPQHVAIIMDGNGRWGLKKKKSRNLGHKEGVKVVQKILEVSIKKKIKYLTLYTFSTENWKRPVVEIKYLLSLLENYIDQELENLLKKGIKLKVIGNIKKFPIKLVKKLNKAEKLSKDNSVIQLNIALNYGSRDEIIKSINEITKKKLKITKKNLEDNLYTKNIPDPEILIRTGNTKRLSNFLLWQVSYSEIFFINKLWPDFKKEDFLKIIKTYLKTKRNFGAI